MSKDNDIKSNGQSGEISTIREILMGGYLGAYEKRFAEIESRLTAIEEKLTQSTDQITKNIEQLSSTLKTDFSSRIDVIENHFKEANQDHRKELSNLFSEISNRLLK